MALLTTAVFAAVVPGDPDREAIIQVIREANVLADKVYTQANRHYRSGTLTANRMALIAAGKADMQRIFTDDLVARISKTWVEDQMDNVATGPNEIDFGVSRVDVKDLKIAKDRAEITADVYTYAVDRVERNGRLYRDRMEGKTVTRAALVKVGGVWKIAALQFEPDLDATRHILTPEAFMKPVP